MVNRNQGSGTRILIDRMLDRSRYRGPDGARGWVDSDVGLGQLDHWFRREDEGHRGPYVSDDVVVVCSPNPPGSNTDRAIALRTGGSGDITDSHRLWGYRPYNPDCSTPVCYRGNVYMVRDDGIASCLDLETGILRVNPAGLISKVPGVSPWTIKRASLTT